MKHSQNYRLLFQFIDKAVVISPSLMCLGLDILHYPSKPPISTGPAMLTPGLDQKGNTKQAVLSHQVKYVNN